MTGDAGGRYHHTQVSPLIIVSFGISVIVIMVFVGTRLMPPQGSLLAVFLLLCLWNFRSLTVDVRTDVLSVRFGPGLIRRIFRLDEITAARSVRNHWYRGWGIRRLRHGWLYNVSGLDAVEVELKGGGVHRIGTDEPAALVAAIENARRQSR